MHLFVAIVQYSNTQIGIVSILVNIEKKEFVYNSYSLTVIQSAFEIPVAHPLGINFLRQEVEGSLGQALKGCKVIVCMIVG